jgi:hypothetical protein
MDAETCLLFAAECIRRSEVTDSRADHALFIEMAQRWLQEARRLPPLNLNKSVIRTEEACQTEWREDDLVKGEEP